MQCGGSRLVSEAVWCNFRHLLRRTDCSAKLPTVPEFQRGGRSAKRPASRGGTWDPPVKESERYGERRSLNFGIFDL